MTHLPTLLLTLLMSMGAWAEIQYESVHDETYWFPDKEINGFQIGTVRSNLVWGDRMSVLLEKADCTHEPIIYMTLLTAEDYPDFDFSSLENKFLELELNFDGKVFERYEVGILSIVEHNQDNFLTAHIVFMEFPAAFYDPWEVLNLKIMENDPNRKYFYLPERQYRMSGFLDVFSYMIQECTKNNE